MTDVGGGPKPARQFIETVDVWQRRHVRWPIVGALAPDYVDHIELRRRVMQLLASGDWKTVRAVPHADPQHPYQHVFDIYGEPR